MKIQTQIARNTQFECALNDATDESPGESGAGDRPVAEADFTPLWFEPDSITLSEGRHGTLEVTLPDGTVHRSVFAVRCFPATRPEDFISLRTWDKEGHDRELGIVRNLDRWSARSQELIRSSLARRYFLRRVEGIDGIMLEYGHLPSTSAPTRARRGSRCGGVRARHRTSVGTRQGAARHRRQSLPDSRRRCVAGQGTRAVSAARVLVERGDLQRLASTPSPFGRPLPLASGRGRFMPSPGTPGEGDRQAG